MHPVSRLFISFLIAFLPSILFPFLFPHLITSSLFPYHYSSYFNVPFCLPFRQLFPLLLAFLHFSFRYYYYFYCYFTFTSFLFHLYLYFYLTLWFILSSTFCLLSVYVAFFYLHYSRFVNFYFLLWPITRTLFSYFFPSDGPWCWLIVNFRAVCKIQRFCCLQTKCGTVGEIECSQESSRVLLFCRGSSWTELSL